MKAKPILIGVGVLAGVVVLALGGGYGWAKMSLNGRLAQKFEAHDIDIPVPVPLTEAELDELRQQKLAERAEGEEAPATEGEEGEQADPLAGVDLDAIALERARARGQHLVEARFACIECHGKDFGGGVMVDDGAMGTWLGPNITIGGKGSRTANYAISDWDHIVRHGIKPDGTPAMMPSEDFVGMSDQELSDIISYIQSKPPVDADVARPTFGPIGLMLGATGALPLSAEQHHDHHAAHPALPPEATVSVEFGAHLVQVCTGCHRKELNGGPIPVGPPDWPPAGNLTKHADGLEGWDLDQFKTLMRTGKRADGTEVKAPMNLMMPYANNMTDVELEALWTYLQSLPATPTGT